MSRLAKRKSYRLEDNQIVLKEKELTILIKMLRKNPRIDLKTEEM